MKRMLDERDMYNTYWIEPPSPRVGTRWYPWWQAWVYQAGFLSSESDRFYFLNSHAGV